jgi:ATP-binding cassette subfamily B protein
MGEPEPLSPELVAALAESPRPPGRELLWLLRADLLAPTALGAALALVAGSVIVEVVLWRGLFDLDQSLGLAAQRLGAMVALLVFCATLLLLDLPIASGLLRLGRQLEARLRLAFLEKIPRLNDRYFQSRPSSDMAERSHSMHQLRLLPELGGQLLRLCELAPDDGRDRLARCAERSSGSAGGWVAIGLPLAVRPRSQRDLRPVPTLCPQPFLPRRLLGLTAVRTHGAEPPGARHRLLVGGRAPASICSAPC